MAQGSERGSGNESIPRYDLDFNSWEAIKGLNISHQSQIGMYGITSAAVRRVNLTWATTYRRLLQ